MWQAFELMHRTFKSGAELYLEGQRVGGTLVAWLTKPDMLPALDNFIAFGSQQMVQSPAYIEGVVGMVRDIFHDEKVGGMDRIYGCKLAESIMLNLRGHVDQCVPMFIELAMNAIASDELKVKSYRIHLLEMVINAIHYSPILALRVLEAKGWTNKFFSSWFSNIENLTRVHDKKLSILAISALLTLKADDVPTSVQQGWPRLLQGVVRLFQTLPAAIKSRSLVEELSPSVLNDLDREEITRDNDFQLNEDDNEEGEWEGEEEWTHEGEEAEGDVKDESSAYLEFLQDQVSLRLLPIYLNWSDSRRHKSTIPVMTPVMTSWKRKAC